MHIASEESKLGIIDRSEIRFDLDRLREDVETILDMTTWHPTEQQISLQHSSKDVDDRWYEGVGSNWEVRDGKWKMTQRDDELSVLNEALRDSYIEHVITSMPFKPIRTRLMRLEPRKCYTVHRDPTARWHVAIKTNQHSLFIFTKDQMVVNVPTDGHAYFLDTTREHTAMNGSPNEERIHLVMLDPSHAIPSEELNQYL